MFGRNGETVYSHRLTDTSQFHQFFGGEKKSKMKLELEEGFEDVLGSRAVLKKVRLSLSLTLSLTRSKFTKKKNRF